MAATLATREVAEAISRAGPFMHGPTFMGNPLACAVATASTRLLLGSPWLSRVKHIETRLRSGLEVCRGAAGVADVRVLGAIGVVEFTEPVDMAWIQPRLVEKGVWLRPFGRLLYTMPPYVTGDEDLETVIRAMTEVVAESAER